MRNGIELQFDFYLSNITYYFKSISFVCIEFICMKKYSL